MQDIWIGNEILNLSLFLLVWFSFLVWQRSMRNIICINNISCYIMLYVRGGVNNLHEALHMHGIVASWIHNAIAFE